MYLDAKLFPDGTLRILDEKEYLKHKAKFGYSDELDEVLKYSMKEVVKKMERREFPFCDEKIREYYDKFLKLLEKK